jgi:hypothetical protein
MSQLENYLNAVLENVVYRNHFETVHFPIRILIHSGIVKVVVSPFQDETCKLPRNSSN